MEDVDQARETLMPKTIVLVATLDTQGKVLLPLACFAKVSGGWSSCLCSFLSVRDGWHLVGLKKLR
jgi:hypothetical protein